LLAAARPSSVAVPSAGGAPRSSIAGAVYTGADGDLQYVDGPGGLQPI